MPKEPGYKKNINSYLFYSHPDNLDKDNRGQYLFEYPGVYRIKAVLSDYQIGRKIESNILAVEVQEPKGDDAVAYQFIKNIQDDDNKKVYYGNFLLKSWIHDPSEIKEKQAEFIEQFPNSKYSSFLYYSLGQRYTSSESQEIQRGIEYLVKAANCEDFLFLEDSIQKLIEIFTKSGQTDMAEVYKEILAKRLSERSKAKRYMEVTKIEPEEPVEQYIEPPAKKSLGFVTFVAGMVITGILFAGFSLFLKQRETLQ